MNGHNYYITWGSLLSPQEKFQSIHQPLSRLIFLLRYTLLHASSFQTLQKLTLNSWQSTCHTTCHSTHSILNAMPGEHLEMGDCLWTSITDRNFDAPPGPYKRCLHNFSCSTVSTGLNEGPTHNLLPFPHCFQKHNAVCRFYRALIMVHNTQKYWGFGLCPSSGILKLEDMIFQKLDLLPSSGGGEHLLCF
jgi:hypothetical protein